MGGRGASSSIKPKLTQSQMDSVDYYVSGEGMWINNYLRGREDFGELSSDEKEYLKDLDTLTSNNKVEQNTLYRTVDVEAIFGSMSYSEYDDLRNELVYNTFSKAKGQYSQNMAKMINDRINRLKGEKITEKGFMSTTKDLSIAENNMYFFGSQKPIILEINNVKGKKGYDVLKGSSKKLREVEARDPQKEVLLGRNQSYTIQDITTKNGNIYVKVRI